MEPLTHRDRLTLGVLLGIACCILAGAYTFRAPMVHVDAVQEQRTFVFYVDVNRADALELSQLPRIGEILAGRIIEHRETYGPFRDFMDLEKVRGIGPRTRESLSVYLAPIEQEL